MKWGSLLKDIKDKVGFSASTSAASSSAPYFDQNSYNATSSSYDDPLSREIHELELDFKRSWDEFRTSNSEMEKEKALNVTIDVFCRLVNQLPNLAQLNNLLVETHIFSFVVGRAFVSDIERLKVSSKTRSLEIESVISFFTEDTQDEILYGSNLLHAVGFLVSGPIDKQSLLDSGIMLCLVHILDTLLGSDGGNVSQKVVSVEDESEVTENIPPDRRFEVEGCILHIMKALASHPSASQGLIEDNSLKLLFEVVANGSLVLFSRYKEGLVPLHTIQLHRHAMQVLGLLLSNDNGSTAAYIRKHQLIKVLLMGVKGFTPESGDPAYTMGIVDLLLECVELSYRHEAGGIRLREDIHNAHGYQFLIQFALVLSGDNISQNTPDSEGSNSKLTNDMDTHDTSSESLSPTLSRLLDVVVNLAQTGATESTGSPGSKGTKNYQNPDDNYKVKDLDAVQMLQDIFLKANSINLQSEVLNRMFKIFSSHLENYNLCQQLRTVPLLILNMGGFPSSFQEIILKILEYAVTVVNCIPEQELLSLCCLLQQPVTSDLKRTILSFFVKLVSFDQQYKKFLREVGVLDVLLDDLKQHKFLVGPEQQNNESKSPNGFMKHLDGKDAILSSPKMLDSGSGKFLLFEGEGIIAVAWDCLVSLLRKSEHNQVMFRSGGGVTTVLPFLASDVHRSGVLRVLSCLIIEDSAQAHPDELGALVEASKSGMIITTSGSQYKLTDDAKCDIFGAIWRVLGANTSAQRVFGESTGFSLILTTLHTFHGEKDQITPRQSPSTICIKVFTYMLRVITAGTSNNAVNRVKLHTIISSHTFCDLLSESGLICVEFEKQVMQLVFELALEVLVLPSFKPENSEESESGFKIVTSSGLVVGKQRIYNAGAVKVLIRLLLVFSPKLQVEFLKLLEELASGGSFNQESLTSAGCVELLLETIHPFLSNSSPLLPHAFRIIEILGSYKLSSAELRMIIRYTLQVKQTKSGQTLVDMIERFTLSDNNIPLAPFLQLDMSKSGHASIQVPLGDRSWPPPAGYSFVCWFQFQNFLKSPDPTSQSQSQQVIRIFSVNGTDTNNTFYSEIYLQDDGTLTLATSSSSSLSFSNLDLDKYRWQHLAIVHSKPNALAGLFQASVSHVYLNGKLKHTGKLGYSPSSSGKSLQVTIGTPVSLSRIGDLSWKIRSCYLFEEVLTPGCVFFMYVLGRGYRGLFQDTNLLQFVPNQACGGGSMSILDSLETDLALALNTQKGESSKQETTKSDRSGIVWDLEILRNLSLQLSGRKLIFSFDGTCTEALKVSGTLSMMNLVDPVSAAASPLGGIPRFGRLNGDIYVCKHSTIGETMRPIGGLALVLALVQVSETRDMLHMALTLFASSLHQNPQNVNDMKSYRGYHLLALLLHPKMSLFDMHSLDIFFQISACEASFPGPKKLEKTNILSPVKEADFEDLNLVKFRDDASSIGSYRDMDDFSLSKDAYSHISELDNVDSPTETSNCVVLSNPDMVEHVLLDWTLWVASTVPIQISLLSFLENLVSMHWYRNHNLTLLRKINLVQHLLVTLHRGDVEVPVLEKLVVLLGVILKDGFLVSELEHVVRFVIMTFDPPELTSRNEILRESMGKHVIVRNMLLEMLIDLLVTISSEELLEQWHKIVSSKLITYFFDEAVHPTTMRWVMTLLGVCLTTSSTFSLKFRTGGGYQGLVRVLPSFYDSPDIYYILFCLIFGKPVYPRLPEVRLLDFHALIPSDLSHSELKFLELLESVIAMAKSTFDKLSIRTMVAYESGGVGLVAEILDACTEVAGELQGEALMHKTYAARLMGGDASAPAAATSVLRFMVDLAKICPPFSAVCRRAEFLEKCVDLYFSCVRSAHAVKMARKLMVKSEDKNSNDCDETTGSLNSMPLEQEHYSKTSISLGSFPPGTSSEDIPVPTTNSDEYKEHTITSPPPESHKPIEDVNHVSVPDSDTKDFSLRDQKTTPESPNPVGEADNKDFSFHDQKTTPESHKPVGESSSNDFSFPDQKATMESPNPVGESDTKDFSFPDQKTTPESSNPVGESVSKDFSFPDQKTTPESPKPVGESGGKHPSFPDQKTTPESPNPVGESDSKDISFPDQKTTSESLKPVGESGSKDFSFLDQKTTPESHKPFEESESKDSSFHDQKTTPESVKPVGESDSKDSRLHDQKTTPESLKPVEESSTKQFSFHDQKTTPQPIRQSSSLSSVSLNIFDSPFLSEKTSGVHKTQSSSQLFAMSSWQSSSFMESKQPKLAPSPSMASSVSMTLSLNEYDSSSDIKRTPHLPNPTETYFPINPLLLVDADDSGYGGGPSSAGATAILDFMGEVLSDFVTDISKATPQIETVLENVPLYIDSESLLVFQGLCLSRLMNFLERRILRDDEEDDKKLDKTRWSTNLDALCSMIVDRVYMGAFPEPSGVLKTLEFLLSMLQLANKDGRIEQAGPPGKGILSIGRSKQLDAYVVSMFKNMNRIIMYCFHPQFLISLGEDELLSRLGLQIEPKKRSVLKGSEEDGVTDICTVLQLLVAHKRLIFCPSNSDNDLNCCLCINITSLLHDSRQNAQNSAVEILKYLLVYRKTALEDLLVSKPNQGPVLDAFHGGFDRLVTGTTSSFFDWLNSSEVLVSKTLEQCAGVVWVQYIAGSVKFPGGKIKNIDARRKKEITRKSKESRKFDQRHWEQINERRIALQSVCDQMCTELRVVRQDKYGWVLHAESEWQTHLQQLVHERGIFPILKSVSIEEPQWQLCPIEGPYRMRKKIERCKLKVDMIETILNGEFEGGGEFSLTMEKDEIDLHNSDRESGSFSILPHEVFDVEIYNDSVDNVKDAGSTRIVWNDGRDDSVYEASVVSAVEFSVKSSSIVPPRDNSVISESVRVTEEKLEKELSDNGEYLIRPYLKHNEKIKWKYNCERVMSLDKHDGIFLIGEHCLYIIENFYIDESGCICEKESEDDLSVIDQALGVKKDASVSMNSVTKPSMSWDMNVRRAWAHNSGAWGRENSINSSNVPHVWRMWKLNSVHEIMKRDYQLRPVAIEIFSMDGCNDLLVFHKKEREEVVTRLVAMTMNLPKNSMLDPTISGAVKQESTLKFMDKTFAKRWQNGEISNFQYLMHVNTLAGRGYSDLTQYPVFPWILSDYESEDLDLTKPETFRKLDKSMGCQTIEGELEFKKRFDSWEDPEIPKFHYGSHYSSAGIVLFYLIRLPPFSSENQKLQGGQFDHADRLFHNIHDTWSSAAGKSNTSDVKELIPEFFYLPEFLENRFDLDLGEKQSGEKIGDVGLPPWAKGSTREFIKKHREALESDYVSENLHHWIDLIFGYKQRGKAAEEAVNVFYHYTYEGSVDIDAVEDPGMKAAILAQINHFGQTPKQIYTRPHVKRKTDRKPPLNPLKLSARLVPHEIRKMTSPIAQIVTHNDKIIMVGPNNLLKPRTYTKYVSWGFPDRSLRFMTYDQDRLLSTHENLHGGHQIQCASASLDGQLLVTGADDGMVCVWRIGTYGGPRAPRSLILQQSLCAHTDKITRIYVSQPYMMILSGSDDCTVIMWDLSSLVFLRQLPEFPFPISALFMNDLNGEIVTAAGVLLAVWSINGDCLAVVNTSQLPSDYILSVGTCTFSDWVETNWYISGHQSGAIKVWQMVHSSSETARTAHKHPSAQLHCGLGLEGKVAEYTLLLHKVLKGHKHPVTALHLSSDLKLLLSGDSDGHLFSWTLPDENLRNSVKWG